MTGKELPSREPGFGVGPAAGLRVPRALVVMAVLAFSLLVAPAAFASGASPFDAQLAAGPLTTVVQPPQVRGLLRDEYIFATRAQLDAEVEPFDVLVRWRAEYATSEQVLDEGLGTLAGEGLLEEGGTQIVSVGEPDLSTPGAEKASFRVLHHLKPSTPYYVRFILIRNRVE